LRGTSTQRFDWVPKTVVADKIGDAINPGGHPQLASGFISGLSADSRTKDAAYLYVQWMHSEKQSLVITCTVQISQYFGPRSTFWARIAAMPILGVVTVLALRRYLARAISYGAVKG
jgi:hypothetical protein